MYDLRCDRAQSWIKRAEAAADLDAKFVFLWIAFDSLFGQAEYMGRRSDLDKFLTKVIELDGGESLPAAMSGVRAEALVLVQLKYLYRGYWTDARSADLREGRCATRAGSIRNGVLGARRTVSGCCIGASMS